MSPAREVSLVIWQRELHYRWQARWEPDALGYIEGDEVEAFQLRDADYHHLN